jgi:hypothetical protein
MRQHARTLLIASVLLGMTGCGTFQNLMAPPATPDTIPMMGINTCEPFGGAGRSLFAGCVWTLFGTCGWGHEIGQGGLLIGTGSVCAGALALTLDAPLSLLGDVLTLPIVHARKNGEPWATWWGEQPGKFLLKESPTKPNATLGEPTQPVPGPTTPEIHDASHQAAPAAGALGKRAGDP